MRIAASKEVLRWKLLNAQTKRQAIVVDNDLFKLNSYKFMLALGAVDCSQSCFWFLLPALISLSFSLALCSPWAAISYSPDQFSWAYDESRPLSNLVQSLEEIIEVAGIPVAGLIYGAIFFAILYKRINGLVLRQTGAVAERKVLIQAFVITVYCTVLNSFWHNSKWLLPNTKTAKCALNFMWICNGAVNPLIYLAVNS
uniref:G_PROTEIN_RECEP_F1_2 domain-containing protein n=1 Tax=Globodera pallida TaxID=36090 RepID=A0A183BKF5_GLOPA